MANTMEISWTTIHETGLGTREGREIKLRYDLEGRHWLCFRQEDEDGSEIWTNVPLSPDRLRRVLTGDMPVGHAAANADYLMVSKHKNGWTQSATLVAQYAGDGETPPMDIPTTIAMGALSFPKETFERWMEETTALPDPFMPERREDGPEPEARDQDPG